jgi:hypothetical protein
MSIDGERISTRHVGRSKPESGALETPSFEVETPSREPRAPGPRARLAEHGAPHVALGARMAGHQRPTRRAFCSARRARVPAFRADPSEGRAHFIRESSPEP